MKLQTRIIGFLVLLSLVSSLLPAALLAKTRTKVVEGNALFGTKTVQKGGQYYVVDYVCCNDVPAKRKHRRHKRGKGKIVHRIHRRKRATGPRVKVIRADCCMDVNP